MITQDAFNKTKVPPHNLEAEVAVLGSMLIDEESVARVIELLAGNKQSFYDSRHREIFQGIVDLFNENKPVDIITLADHLTSGGLIEKVGGASYIADLTTSVATSANIVHHARIVKEKYILRSLIHEATKIIADSYESVDDAEGLLDRAEKTIFDIADKKFSEGVTPIKVLVRNQVETIDRLYQRKETITGIATGFHEFDTQTAGLQPSDLIVVAARPSMGKSAFMSCIAEHASIILKIPTAIFSLEMSKEQLVQRMLCSRARIDAHKVRTGFLAQSDWPALTSAAAKLSESPLYIDDTPGLTAIQLKAKARRLKAQHDIKLIMVDYLQLMQGAQGSESRQQEISEISRSLKGLAREINVPLIAVSQLSRAVESRTDHRPQLSDLRESGAIEQDADVVVLLLREEYYNPTEENKGRAEVIIAKQRNGPIGSLQMTFIREYTRFENAEIIRREEMP